MSDEIAISANQLCLTYESKERPIEAFRNVDLSISRGEFVSFIGPSGCGKTSLLRAIADLEIPTSGTLSINGMSAEKARLARDIGYVFQAPSLMPWRSVEDNICVPLEIMGIAAQERTQRIEHVLKLVDLYDFKTKFPSQLSGGMQQRVSIARALAFDAKLLLMDEPFGALDEISREHLNEQLLKLWRQTGKTICFVTHSISEAVFLSTKIVVMSARPGEIIDVIEPNLPDNRSADIRESKAFLQITKRIRAAL
ncbi:MAG: ABC transporter ATP-binding protein, partial [Nitratireductor sp.]